MIIVLSCFNVHISNTITSLWLYDLEAMLGTFEIAKIMNMD